MSDEQVRLRPNGFQRQPVQQFLVWTCGHLQDKHIVLDEASSEVEAILRRAELGVMLLDHLCDLDFIYRESHLHDASLVSASVIEDEST